MERRLQSIMKMRIQPLEKILIKKEMLKKMTEHQMTGKKRKNWVSIARMYNKAIALSI